MSDLPEAKPRLGGLKWALWGAALVGVAVALYIIAGTFIKPDQGLKRLAKGEMSKLVEPAEPTGAPAETFLNPDGRPTRIADFRGKVVVMNLWATWCAPCVAEMPTLAKLQADYAGKPVEVVAVSVDSEKDAEKARLFIAKHAPLKFYQDPKTKMPFVLTPPAPGMPTTVIYGADGMERARMAGDADWSGPEAKAVIEAILAEG